MKLTEAQQKFIHIWGSLGSSWGINKTMAQIHALLLASPEPLSTEQIMEVLSISRGNANMNVRTLADWGLVMKEIVSGDRKDYYSAKKDIQTIARQIVKQRRKKELEPMLSAIKDVRMSLSNSKDNPESFSKQVSEIEDFAIKIDQLLEKFERSDESWFFKILMKVI